MTLYVSKTYMIIYHRFKKSYSEICISLGIIDSVWGSKERLSLQKHVEDNAYYYLIPLPLTSLAVV